MKIMRENTNGFLGSPKCVVSEHEQAATNSNPNAYPDIAQDMGDMYGSGAAIVDAKCGYGDDCPDSVTQDDDAIKFGYEYSMVTTDSRGQRPRSCSPKGIAPQRSSMKGSTNSTGTLRRRASIGQMSGCGEFEVVFPGAVRRRRSISFDEGVRVREIHPIESFTDKPESLWLQDEEIAYIRQQISSLVKNKIRYAETSDNKDSSLKGGADDGECCTRGLERMLKPEQTRVKKFQAWDTVMNEQYLQRDDGKFDHESLAVMYGHVTRRSQREAQRRASKDAEDIESYLSSTRQMCRRFSK
jgi:hypothetical protein